MRFFCRFLYRNVLWIYFIAIFVLGYSMLLEKVPGHIYVEKGEVLENKFGEYLSFVDEEDSLTTFSEMGDATFKNVLGQHKAPVLIATKDCKLTCFLFGLVPLKSVDVTISEKESVYASGKIIGIYEHTDGVLVLDTSAVKDIYGNECIPSDNLVKGGDYIVAVNNKSVATKDDLINAINKYGKENEALTLKINRNGKLVNKKITPVMGENGVLLLGIWIKDDMAGIGTLTYYDTKGKFGALGHGIGDGASGRLLSVSDGAIYNMELTGITKGESGTPGELTGTIYYGRMNHIGDLSDNDDLGIYGSLDENDMIEFEKNDGNYEIAYKQDIKKGEAHILSGISGTVKAYDIEIEKIDYEAEDSNKGILFEVKDEELEALTGGIVQGMSGSPIIQNGRIVGAVTHVLVNDPTKGYGIFIETMLEKK